MAATRPAVLSCARDCLLISRREANRLRGDLAACLRRLRDMVQENPRTGFPRHAQRKVTAILAAVFKCAQTGAPQVFVKTTDWGAADHVARRSGRKCRDRQAARQSLEQHKAECVGTAREYKNVGGGIDFCQRLAAARANKDRAGKFSLKRWSRRPIADNDLAAGQIERQKCLEVFLDREPSDGEKNRPRQIKRGTRARAKQ